MGASWLTHGFRNRGVERLTCIRSRVEEIEVPASRAVVVAVHSHAPLAASVDAVLADEVAVIAIPCCVDLTLPNDPDWSYRDEGIWSPANEVRVWRNAK